MNIRKEIDIDKNNNIINGALVEDPRTAIAGVIVFGVAQIVELLIKEGYGF